MLRPLLLYNDATLALLIANGFGGELRKCLEFLVSPSIPISPVENPPEVQQNGEAMSKVVSAVADLAE
jgi:hypothetical protein